MSINLPDIVKRYLSPDFISKASTLLGENEAAVSKALTGVVPSLFSGFISKATTADAAGANELLNMGKENYSSGILENPGNLFSGGGILNKGAGMMQSLFGNKFTDIIGTIATFAGIKNSSANSLFSLAAPVAMATVGKHAVENNLDASGLSSFLANQKANVANMLPVGLSGIISMPGFGRADENNSSNSGNRTKDIHTAVNNTKRVVKKAGHMSWLLWVFIFVIAALIAWYYLLGGKSGSISQF